MDSRPNELIKILVTRNNHCFEALSSSFHGKRTNDIIGLISFEFYDRIIKTI